MSQRKEESRTTGSGRERGVNGNRLRGFCATSRQWLLMLLAAAWFFSLTGKPIAAVCQDDGGGNSTERQRVEPDEVAARAGTAIAWETDFKIASDRALMSGKPVFWYVPTLDGTFMDRKPVIDRYMMGGPFSWPAIIALINERTIPLKMTPRPGDAEQFGLQPYEFVEPGFVLLRPDGTLQQKVDRLTTLHPYWLFGVLGAALGDQRSWSQASGEPDRGALDEVWQSIVASDWQTGVPAGFAVPPALSMELELLRGMCEFRQGRHEQARGIWRNASREHVDHPLAWKAALEAQGIGPFGRGFEVFGVLPPRALLAGVESPGSAAPTGTYNAPELWARSAAYLCGMQNENGGFYDSDYDFGGFDSLSNVHMAVTALAASALLESQSRVTDPELLQRIRLALSRAMVYCLNDSMVNGLDRDEILWAEAYRLRFVVAAYRATGDKKMEPSIQRLVKRLENLQMKNGSWFHEYPNSFVTATALIALHDAQNITDVTLDAEKRELGLKRLTGQRFDNGAYPYGTRREGAADPRRVEPVAAAAGRIPLCELARHRWGATTDKGLAEAAAIGIEHHALLAKALKYDNHTSTYAYGGFFFWYDMQARSEAIASVADSVERKRLAKLQWDLILDLPELDGCFVDSHELGRCYGTAMAMLSLALTERALAE